MSFVQVCQLCFHCSCTALLSGLCFFLSQSHPISLSSMKLIILSVLKRLVFCSALSGRLFLIHSVALLLYGVFKVNLFKYFSSCYQAWRLVFWACSTGSWHWQEMSNIADCHEHVKDWSRRTGQRGKRNLRRGWSPICGWILVGCDYMKSKSSSFLIVLTYSFHGSRDHRTPESIERVYTVNLIT